MQFVIGGICFGLCGLIFVCNAVSGFGGADNDNNNK